MSLLEVSEAGRVALRFTVLGKPEPAGSKKAFVPQRELGTPRQCPKCAHRFLTTAKEPYRDAHGRIVVSVTDDNPKSKGWKREVGHAAKAAMKGLPLFRGALFLTATFYMPRPQYHFGTGKNRERLKADAPELHTVKPDRTKLLRAVEDGMTGIVWSDDAQVVSGPVEKRYGDPPRVEIEVRQIGEDAA